MPARSQGQHRLNVALQTGGSQHVQEHAALEHALGAGAPFGQKLPPARRAAGSGRLGKVQVLEPGRVPVSTPPGVEGCLPQISAYHLEAGHSVCHQDICQWPPAPPAPAAEFVHAKARAGACIGQVSSRPHRHCRLLRLMLVICAPAASEPCWRWQPAALAGACGPTRGGYDGRARAPHIVGVEGSLDCSHKRCAATGSPQRQAPPRRARRSSTSARVHLSGAAACPQSCCWTRPARGCPRPAGR